MTHTNEKCVYKIVEDTNKILIKEIFSCMKKNQDILGDDDEASLMFVMRILSKMTSDLIISWPGLKNMSRKGAVELAIKISDKITSLVKSDLNETGEKFLEDYRNQS